MNEPQSIPEDIRRFVLTSIASVPHLEALLLLHASGAQDWPVQLVAERLYIAERRAGVLLDDLAQAGLLALSGDQNAKPMYRYGPTTAALRAAVDALAVLYARQLVSVTHLIHSKLDRHAQQFADAFKLRKD